MHVKKYLLFFIGEKFDDGNTAIMRIGLLWT